MQATQAPIVVGIDESPEVHSAVDWAAHDAKTRDGALRVVCAYHGSDSQLARDLVAETVDRIASKHGVQATGDAVEGDAVQVLHDESARASLVVVGSRRHKSLGSSVLGSVSGAVAARSESPVVVLCGPAGMPEEEASVVVGVDGTEASAPLLEFGFERASRHHVGLRAVLCWHTDVLATMSWRGAPSAPSSVEEWLSDTLAGWRTKYPDVEVHPEVVREHPKTGIVAASQGQYLLVVGNHGRHALAGTMLGSVSQRALHHATCPVAVIPTHNG